ncbi:hypothetical protein OS493_033440 [Desmophyllum pertusum]|uniref:Uncharacterized protein n=1 Tax=Desmophyllum pertusum TaxID=174260 RepID=A0A9W9ZWD9_9CNID|nr:hypothetical protein OS493_033440 [Desmophyllum pertusum]
METMTFLLVVFAALVLIEAKPTQKHCSKIRRNPCSEDSECACLNHRNSTLICNYKSICEISTFIDDIMRRQPCHRQRIFKRSCLVDADCPCDEAPLICEDNECVKKRPKIRTYRVPMGKHRSHMYSDSRLRRKLMHKLLKTT